MTNNFSVLQMIQSWIEANKQTALSVGVNDVTLTVPVSQLERYAGSAVYNVPISMPCGLYEPTGWAEREGDRVDIRLSKISHLG